MTRTDTIIRVLPGEKHTAYGLAKKLSVAAILESASFDKGRERYSLLIVRPAFTVSQTAEGVVLQVDGKRYRVGGKARDVLDVLLYFADQHKPPNQDFPFPAGGIGFLSYEFAAYCDTIEIQDREDPLDLPVASFLFAHVFAVFDHYTDLVYLIGLNYKEHEIDLEEAVAEVEARIGDMDFNYLQAEERVYRAHVVDGDSSSERYLAGVEAIREEIVAGNLLQAVLARRIRVRTEMPAIEAYRRLRTSNPSPYLFYLDFGGYQLFGSSPEVHVRVKHEEAMIRPIAGTRKRGVDRADDQRLERELLADPKEKAEHLMLVDLARNDIGRVCRPGTVRVTEYMGIERYSHVMHIVSEARGTLDAGRTGIDALRATFPAGTVSGAPKIRAIEVLDNLEPVPRRFYAGLVGYVEPGGDLDTCITIRSAVKRNDELILQAGAGIVYDSTPERELEETREKLAALAFAAGLEVNL
jgi:anthranilate synthase component 1